MNNLWQDIRIKLFHSGSKLGLLIGINVLVFLLLYLPGNFGQYLQLPANLSALAKYFWTPLTYMFVHAGFWHLLCNMIWLYWMGQIFEEYLGNKRIIWLYLLGGLAGAIFFLAGMNLLPMFKGYTLAGGAVVGASAGVMAIVIATATLLPDNEIFLMIIGRVKLKWLAVAFVVFDFLNIMGPNAGGEMAHLGGALIGFIYIKQLQRGNDWNKPLTKMFNQPKIKIVTGGGGNNRTGKPRQDEVDNILDKISQSGYDSLSNQEKETLFRASKNER